MHGDEASCKRHKQLEFHDGWGKALDQLVAAVKKMQACRGFEAVGLARHFNVIGISTDDDAARASAWLKESNATISQFIDARLQMENMLGASRLPLTVLVDADGRVIEKIYGAREWDSPESVNLIR